METAPTTATEGTQSVSTVTSPQPENVPSTTGPSYWKALLRPTLSATPTHDDRKHQLTFDVLFAGAKSIGRWEDDWPIMDKATFVQKLKDVSTLEIGGHNPDGTHPRSKKSKE